MLQREEGRTQESLDHFATMPLQPQERVQFESLMASWKRHREATARVVSAAQARNGGSLVEMERRQ